MRCRSLRTRNEKKCRSVVRMPNAQEFASATRGRSTTRLCAPQEQGGYQSGLVLQGTDGGLRSIS